MKSRYPILITLLLLFSASIKVFSQAPGNKIQSVESSVNETSAIKNFKESIEVIAYPNPASRIITFTFKGFDIENISVEIFQITGQPAITFKPDNFQYVLDVTGMKEGLYFYKVLYNGKVFKTEKFVVLKK